MHSLCASVEGPRFGPLLELLMASGANINQRNEEGLTPLESCLANQHGRSKPVEGLPVDDLIRHGAIVTHRCLQLALSFVDDTSTLSTLLEHFHLREAERERHDMNRHDMDEIMDSVLIFASFNGMVKEARDLIDTFGVDVNCRNSGKFLTKGDTPLLAAVQAMEVSVEMVALLKGKGGDPYLENENGESAISLTQDFLLNPTFCDINKLW